MIDDMDYTSSQAVLIGTSHYQDPYFPQLPAVANSLNRLQQTLTDPALCGWLDDHVKVLANPVDVRRLVQTLRRLAEQTSDVLLLYIVGHGVILPRGRLCLVTADTDAKDPDVTGLEYDRVRELLLDSPARLKIVILDCCYSGRAIEALSATSEIADITEIRGVYTLTASDHAAHVPPPEEQVDSTTSFTGELIDLIRSGIPDGPDRLSLSTLYLHLRRRLQLRGLPLPNQRSIETADRHAFTRNAAHLSNRERPQLGEPTAITADPNLNHATSLVNEAEEIANVLGDKDAQKDLLIAIARPLARIDSVRAEQLARTVTDLSSRSGLLAHVAETAWEPVRAVRLFDEAVQDARAVPDGFMRSVLLCNYAVRLTDKDPRRATHLFKEAEQAARTISNISTKIVALCGVIKKVDSSNPQHAAVLLNEAEVIGKRDTGYSRLLSLLHVAKTVAIVKKDMSWVARLLREVEPTVMGVYNPIDANANYGASPSGKAQFTEILAFVDPDRAEQITQGITDEDARLKATAGAASSIAYTDPWRAEQMVCTTMIGQDLMLALLHMVEVVAVSNPVYATRLLEIAEDAARIIPDEAKRATMLYHLAGAPAACTSQASVDRRLKDAERWARTIPDDFERGRWLAWIADAWLGTG
jgi:Caspase domain